MLTGPLELRRERARVAERVRAVIVGGGAVPDLPDERTAERDGLDHPAPPPLFAEWPAGGDAPRGAGRGDRLRQRAAVRLDPGRRAAAAVGVAVVLAAVITGVWVFSSRPKAVPVTATAPSGVAAGSPSVPQSLSPATGSASAGVHPSASASTVTLAPPVVVDVAGKVHRPGLYTLAAGSRVDDALHAAGGALPGVSLTSLNLASKVSDGEQIVVGMTGVAPVSGGDPVAPAGGTGSGGPAAVVNLNTSTLEQLETLPGIGPALGQRILDWRTAHGGFSSVSQLNEVSGIGDVRFAQLRPLVSV